MLINPLHWGLYAGHMLIQSLLLGTNIIRPVLEMCGSCTCPTSHLEVGTRSGDHEFYPGHSVAQQPMVGQG